MVVALSLCLDLLLYGSGRGYAPVEDSETKAARLLAQNPATPVPVLTELAAGSNRTIKFVLLDNRAVPVELRRKLARELGESARPEELINLAGRTEMPVELLAKFSEELLPTVRAAVALNPNTDRDTLMRLAAAESSLVAAPARRALQQKFPKIYTRLTPEWTTLDSLDRDPTLFARFQRAIANNDLKDLALITDYARKRPTLNTEVSLAAGAQMLVSARYEPVAMDTFLAAGLVIDAEIVVHSGDPRWLTFFKDKGIFEGGVGVSAMAVAIDWDRYDKLGALINLGINVNQKLSYTTPAGQTLLHRAVSSGKPKAVALLMSGGADPDATDAEGQTPLDYAARARLAPTIALMDKAGTGKYAALVKKYLELFPPAPASRLLGEWTDGKQDSSRPVLSLEPDGTAQYWSNYPPVKLLAWRETAPNEGVAYLFIQPRDFPFRADGGVDESTEFKFRLNTEGTELVLESNHGEKASLHRMAR